MKTKAAQCFIYALVCPAGIVRYVGVATNPKARLSGHINEAKTIMHNIAFSRPTAKHRWLHGLLSAGVRPILRILEQCTIAEATQKEMQWHEHFALLHELYCTNPRTDARVRY